MPLRSSTLLIAAAMLLAADVARYRTVPLE